MGFRNKGLVALHPRHVTGWLCLKGEPWSISPVCKPRRHLAPNPLPSLLQISLGAQGPRRSSAGLAVLLYIFLVFSPPVYSCWLLDPFCLEVTESGRRLENMGSWISIISPNPGWIQDYGIWTQAAWSIALYDRSDSWGDSLYPTGVGDFSWEAEQADAECNTRRSREPDVPETRSSTLRRGVSSRGPGIQTISTGVSPRSVCNRDGLRTDDTTASLEHTPGTDCSASRPSSMPGRGPLASSCALRPSLNTTGGSLPGPGSAPPHEDSDGESYQTLSLIHI